MKYKQLFFDLDHTLWDFDANARATLEKLHLDLRLVDKGVHDFERFHKNYLQHNEKTMGQIPEWLYKTGRTQDQAYVVNIT